MNTDLATAIEMTEWDKLEAIRKAVYVNHEKRILFKEFMILKEIKEVLGE